MVQNTYRASRCRRQVAAAEQHLQQRAVQPRKSRDWTRDQVSLPAPTLAVCLSVSRSRCYSRCTRYCRMKRSEASLERAESHVGSTIIDTRRTLSICCGSTLLRRLLLTAPQTTQSHQPRRHLVEPRQSPITTNPYMRIEHRSIRVSVEIVADCSLHQ